MQPSLGAQLKLLSLRSAHLGMRQLLSALCLVLLIAACSTPAPPPREVRVAAPSVGEIELLKRSGDVDTQLLLDVGIVIFESQPDRITLLNAPDVGEGVFDELRQNEMQYLPFVLRNTLVESNHWGAVRVLPETDPSVDLVVHGAVLISDGLNLEVAITAYDSAGRQWLNKIYADESHTTDFPESTRYTTASRFNPADFTEPFQDLYDKINNDLVAVRDSLSDTQLVDLSNVSDMVYASDLSPETFEHTLTRNEEQLLTVTTLLAEEDPMMRRMAEMRLRHYAFIDSVDGYYEALFDDMQSLYLTWRHYSRDQSLESLVAEYEIYQGSLYGDVGNFQTLSQRYDRYRWAKIYEFEFAGLASGFNNEIAPAILELNQNVHGLDGNMADQYAQWKRILRALFALESEQEAGSD